MNNDDTKPLPKEELLAIEISKALNDIENKLYYLRLVQKHPEAIIRTSLEQALEVPKNKIRKSRKALFLYLIRKNAEDNS